MTIVSSLSDTHFMCQTDAKRIVINDFSYSLETHLNFSLHFY